MAKRWRIHPHDPARIADLQRAAGVAPVVAQLLVCRGLSEPTRIRDFLDAKLVGLRDPETLPGLPAAADRIMAAVRDQRRIVIYGDYDADGMTATAILWLCLRLLDANVGYHIPNRLEEGYGLSADALRSIASNSPGATVVTVDCGIASLDEAALARELGLELIVTDHHQMAARLPDAAAIVHPGLPGSEYPFDGLSGAGVALKLAWGICQRASDAKKVSERMRNFLLQAVGLAAIGTVADVVPLLDENRIIVRHGLTSLKQRPTPGLAALMKVTKLDVKQQLECEDIGFTIAPRLNAAGRLGQAQLAVELLTTPGGDRAAALAEYLNELNGSRDSLERSIYLAANKQAIEQFDPAGDAALVLADHGWHPGVIGIVAGRLAEKFHRPVVLIALDQVGAKPGVGSARSVAGFDLHAALEACTEHLLGHGGHRAAAGLKIEEAKLAAFRVAFCEHAEAMLTAKDRTAELAIDAETPLSCLTLDAVKQIELMSPFGQGNARPLLCAHDVKLLEPPKKLGSSGRHLSLKLHQHGVSLRGVAFGGGEWLEPLSELQGTISIAFRPVINHFGGRRSVELHVHDWRATAECAVAAVEAVAATAAG